VETHYVKIIISIHSKCYFQLLVFITNQYNIDLLFETFSIFFPITFIVIKYIVFIIQTDDVSLIR